METQGVTYDKGKMANNDSLDMENLISNVHHLLACLFWMRFKMILIKERGPWERYAHMEELKFDGEK